MIKTLVNLVPGILRKQKVQIGLLGGIVYVVLSVIASEVTDPDLAAQLFQLAEWAGYFTGGATVFHFVTDNTSLTTGAQPPRKLPGAIDAPH